MNFKKEALCAIAEASMNLQNNFLDKFKEPRPIDVEIKEEMNISDLMKDSYISLLKDVKDGIEEELSRLEMMLDEDGNRSIFDDVDK